MTHSVTVRKKAEFLRKLMHALAGDARMSLEGDLSRCQLAEPILLGRDETPMLKRNTLAPRQDFLALRLSPDTIAPIFKAVMAAGLRRAVLHVQIERNGVLELGAYDNFAPGCVVTGPGIGSALLEELKASGIVWDFTAVERSNG